MKLPPIEKIPESYTAIEDNRIKMYDNYATVLSSDLKKEYLIKWKDNNYYSNDNSTYWQNYPGYPVLSVLFLQNKLSLNKDISKYFKGINWNKLNKDNKRDYHKSLQQVLSQYSNDEKEKIMNEINNVYEQLQNINIVITKKNL